MLRRSCGTPKPTRKPEKLGTVCIYVYPPGIVVYCTLKPQSTLRPSLDRFRVLDVIIVRLPCVLTVERMRAAQSYDPTSTLCSPEELTRGALVVSKDEESLM